MAKKITALILSLAMVLSISANFIGVMAATNGVNLVKIEYYADKELTTKVDSVKVGDPVYAALKINAFSGVRTLTATLGYDPTSLALMCPDGSLYNNGFVTSNDSESLISDKNYKDGSIGIYQNNISNMVRPGSSVVLPKLWQKSGLAMLTLTWGSGLSSGNVSSEKTIAILAFKALKKNDKADLSIPVALDDVDGEIFEDANADGMLFVTNDSAFDMSNCDVTLNPLSITIDQLNKPNVTFTDRVISWNAIDNASGYKVLIKVSKNGEAPTYNEEFSVGSNVTSINLPTEITNGDVTVSVMAISNDEDLGNSDYSEAKSQTFSINLGTPQNVRWDGEKVKWNAVEGASGYEVILMLGEDQVSTPKIVTETEADFSADLETPTEGKNSYSVTVRALGDGTYIKNSPETGKSGVKNICGSVKAVINPTWVGNSATWTENDDKENVAGYIVCVKKDGSEVYKTQTPVTGSSLDVSRYIAEPGIYTFTVTAIGGSTEDGEYKNSVAKPSINTKKVSMRLNPVENIQWADRVVTWTDSNEYTSVYEVELYKGTEHIATYSNITEKRLDFDAKGADITVGTYKVKITAKGDGDIYLDSMPEESEKTFTARLNDPTNVKWTGTKADWDEVANATSYELALFYNGVDTGIRRYAYAPETEYDFALDMTMPGEYTFTVKAPASNGYSASRAVKSEDPAYNNTVTKQGNVFIKLYEDAGCQTPAADISVGDTFYAAISVENTPAFASYCAPIRFNPQYVKVVDNNNVIVSDGVLSEDLLGEDDTAIFLSEYAMDNSFSIASNDSYPYIDNTRGLIKLIAMTTQEQAITDEKTIVIIKMTAVGMADNTNVIDFAVANTQNDLFDESSMAGFSMSSDAQALILPNFTPTSLPISKGQLAKMMAPVWDGLTLTWVKAAGNNVIGYEIELYKDGTLIQTITVDDPDTVSENMSEYVSSSGKYTARIKALADDIGAIDGEYSELSSEYTVRRGGGGSLGKPVPVKPVEPEEPEKPEEPVKPEFTDIKGHWAEKDIIELVDLGIVNGYGDNTYRPNIGITRAEFTKLMVTCLGLELKGEGHVYGDTANHWAKDYISIGTEIGIVNGIGDNLFDPDRIITREQVAAIIYRMAGKPDVEQSTFVDRGEISDYAKPAVDYVSANGIMIGFEGNKFGGTQDINRAQMATVTLRLWKANFFANYKK